METAKPEGRRPAWDSPWGQAVPAGTSSVRRCQPGARDTFDIHGGSADLTFPHHENEIAQSEGATRHLRPVLDAHNGRTHQRRKMSGLGNFFTVREILQRYLPEVRYFILTSQYRSPLHYADEQLSNARSA